MKTIVIPYVTQSRCAECETTLLGGRRVRSTMLNGRRVEQLHSTAHRPDALAIGAGIKGSDSARREEGNSVLERVKRDRERKREGLEDILFMSWDWIS